ncbi:MAG: hypothetical protein LBF61_05440 [Azoarcus sp.]|jgi:hypothetical protein|nr:hypothetical protein [Azoarcus sp.]
MCVFPDICAVLTASRVPGGENGGNAREYERHGSRAVQEGTDAGDAVPDRQGQGCGCHARQKQDYGEIIENMLKLFFFLSSLGKSK